MCVVAGSCCAYTHRGCVCSRLSSEAFSSIVQFNLLAIDVPNNFDDAIVNVRAHTPQMMSTTTTTTTTTSLNDVAAYQVALWTAILLGGVLLFTLYAMLNIEGDKRDPQLYAQLVDAGSSAAHHRRS